MSQVSLERRFLSVRCPTCGVTQHERCRKVKGPDNFRRRPPLKSRTIAHMDRVYRYYLLQRRRERGA